VQAALALGETGNGAGAALLADSLEACDTDVALCKRIIGVLGKLKEARSVNALLAHLAFVQTRRETVEALAAIADAGSIPALIRCLESDEYVPVRAAAAQALGRLGGARALHALQSASRHEKEEVVLAVVREALLPLARRR
jgi:HEAT repeat protein